MKSRDAWSMDFTANFMSLYCRPCRMKPMNCFQSSTRHRASTIVLQFQRLTGATQAPIWESDTWQPLVLADRCRTKLRTCSADRDCHYPILCLALCALRLLFMEQLLAVDSFGTYERHPLLQTCSVGMCRFRSYTIILSWLFNSSVSI
jgi:hypothetical protein